MPHADTSLVPPSITSKPQFWNHVYEQLRTLFEGQKNWVSNCANASSLIYYSLLSFNSHFGSGDREVNWCGFYIDSPLFPRSSRLGTGTAAAAATSSAHSDESKLLLGPFCGKPACQFIRTAPHKARGVCADAYVQKTTIVVSNVDAYPGHIACDGETKSEIVCPLLLEGYAVGVLDLDCLTLNGFDEDDRKGLERISKLIVDSCEW